MTLTRKQVEEMAASSKSFPTDVIMPSEIVLELCNLALHALDMQPRPISEAPKDGARILLIKIVDHPAHQPTYWWARTGYWPPKWQNWNDGEPSGIAAPNYWAPLPDISALPPPEGGKE